MQCDRCKETNELLYELFHQHCLESTCRKCIVGEYIPVFRPSRQRWNFGIVKLFDDANKCQVVFGSPEGEQEWVELSPKPFHAYVSSYHNNISIVKAAATVPSPPVSIPPTVASAAVVVAHKEVTTPDPMTEHLPSRCSEKKTCFLDLSCPRTPIQESAYRSLFISSATTYKSSSIPTTIGNNSNNKPVSCCASSSSQHDCTKEVSSVQ